MWHIRLSIMPSVVAQFFNTIVGFKFKKKSSLYQSLVHISRECLTKKLTSDTSSLTKWIDGREKNSRWRNCSRRCKSYQSIVYNKGNKKRICWSFEKEMQVTKRIYIVACNDRLLLIKTRRLSGVGSLTYFRCGLIFSSLQSLQPIINFSK